MSLALMSNLLTMMLCVGVIVQATRMMRQLRAVKESDLAVVVTGLDRATGHAVAVLADLKRTLGTDGAALAQSLADSTELREELSVLIGIANAMAERLVEAGQGVPRTTIDITQPFEAAT
jgi:inorganic triphosphatase YgiF